MMLYNGLSTLFPLFRLSAVRDYRVRSKARINLGQKLDRCREVMALPNK